MTTSLGRSCDKSQWHFRSSQSRTSLAFHLTDQPLHSGATSYFSLSFCSSSPTWSLRLLYRTRKYQSPKNSITCPRRTNLQCFTSAVQGLPQCTYDLTSHELSAGQDHELSYSNNTNFSQTRDICQNTCVYAPLCSPGRFSTSVAILPPRFL